MKETQKTRKFKCYICGQEFDSLTELMKHDLKLKHKRDESTDQSSSNQTERSVPPGNVKP